MGGFRDVSGDRYTALSRAVELHRESYATHSDFSAADTAVLATADKFFGFLGGPVVVTLIIGPILDQATGRATGDVAKGSPMQLTDTQKVVLSVGVTDVKGADVPDNPDTNLDDLSWVSDNETVATVQVSADTREATVVAGTVGSAVITVSTGSLFATVAVDVIPSGATALTVTAGDPTEQ